ncbi:hypothetical protein SA2016_3993 [Sinomonas atrocyanea]|uniref:Uncharacterized protein n=1 Tax=Sinomonas atrocyanea TaxID=37927 RepID=A0A127A670_9MICC|nr:hypothetical protein [Sinomonas atrocyanea]AMM34647.1 hypothetical protein SA2016_3993 [Sinomonas atrocyanea]GEB63125.1 hypothetical protein SAT01_05730 [Sinomonas atrocyanea]GGG67224.1 hypothetical protein GCM10007172_18750 [Sinomonas atrocyanea]
MHPLTTAALQDGLARALSHTNASTDALSTDQFSADWDDRPDWAIGPFRKDEDLTFRPQGQWPDPTGIGWTSASIFNPSLIERDGVLHLFYRASPRKESLESRIGTAVHTPGHGWAEGQNPVVYPTLDNELLGVEDPKVYSAEGRYYLFYNGIWPLAGTSEAEAYPSPGWPLGDVGCDINLAVSDDLVHWEKRGRIVPHEVSHLWAKGAVIPTDGTGEAVKIGGEYLMFLSEGCDGRAVVGRSRDMEHWDFAEQPYLDISALGSLHEVACAVATGGNLVLDFFYGDHDGNFAAAQALYSLEDPFTQIALHRGGSLAWGGLIRYGDRWTFAQGWDAPAGQRELYLYRSEN